MTTTTRPALAPEQDVILKFFKGYIDKEGYPPTIRQIGDGTGKAPSTVHAHVNALLRKGYLARAENRLGWYTVV